MTVAVHLHIADATTLAGQRLFGQSGTCQPATADDGSTPEPYTATVVYHPAYNRKTSDPATQMVVTSVRQTIEVRLADCTTAPAQGDVWTLAPDPAVGLPASVSLTVTEREPMDIGCVRLYVEEVIA